jgi:hypothetical protein
MEEAIPKAIENLMADDPEGEVEIVLRRRARTVDATPPGADPQAVAAEPLDPAIAAALEASLKRGRVEPRAPKSYSMPRKAQ